MRYWRFTLVLCFLLAAPALAEEQPAPGPVLLKSLVVVDDPVLRLGDLFEGLPAGADTAVARAPAPGRRVELNARWLAALADGHGIAWRPESALDTAVVSRASQTVGTARIEAEVLKGLASRGVSGDVSVVLDNPALRLHLPVDAEASLALIGLSYDPASGRFNAHLVAPDASAPLVRATVSGRAVQMTEVPVLRRRAVPGYVITRDEIEWRRLRAGRLAGNVVLDPSRLIGKSPRRSIRPGEPVRASDLREPVMVPKKSLVILRLETDRMVLTAQGRALEDGADGQVVRVMNTKSNTIVNGVVAGAGTVRVLPAQRSAGN